MLLKHDPNDPKPCPHMRVWVSALADGTLAGIVRWYTERHIAGCPQCQKGLANVHALHQRLQQISADGGRDAEPLPPARWAALDASWKAAEEIRAEETRTLPSS